MKIVEAFPDDVEVRRAGLELIVSIAEHGDQTSDMITTAVDDAHHLRSTGSNRRGLKPLTDISTVADSLGRMGAAAFVVAWLREATAPWWAWGSNGYDQNGGEVKRARDLLLACKASFLLTQASVVNRDRLTNMGATEALCRALALSGQREDSSKTATETIDVEGEEFIQSETQVWAAFAMAALAEGQASEDRCQALMRTGATRALCAAMMRHPSVRDLQRAGCVALGRVAACVSSFDSKGLEVLGRDGGVRAIVLALDACAGDPSVVLAGLIAVTELAGSAYNRQLLGEAGGCRLVAKVLSDFSTDNAIAVEGCRAIVGLASLSGFNRTILGFSGATEATAAALRHHPSNSITQRWGLWAIAALVADTDPSNNTVRISQSGIMLLVVKTLENFPHDPNIQIGGLRVFAKVASAGPDGADAAWAADVVIPVTSALRLHANDMHVQHWGMSTMRALTGRKAKCDAWRNAGAPEAIARTLHAFDYKGTSPQFDSRDGACGGRLSEARICTPEESLCILFQACAAALNLSISSPDARRRVFQRSLGREILRGKLNVLEKGSIRRE